MTAQTFLDRIRGVRRSGRGWMALCPGHPDRSPSLSIREDNGRILLHCFAGCSVDAVCAALGIATRDLFTEPRQARKLKPLIVRDVERQIASLRSRLTPRDRERNVTVVLASRKNPDHAIVRALAIAVQGELVQVELKEEAR